MTPQSSPDSVLFSSLPAWRAPWSEFLITYGVQIAIIASLFWVPVLTPQAPESRRDYHAIELVPTPVPENHEAQRPPSKPILARRIDPIEPPPEALRLAAPRPASKIEDLPAPTVRISKALDPVAIPAPAIPRQIVRTNLFSSGSSAPQTIERPVQQVQTGGFGDPNGVPAKATQTRAVNIAQAGGFDMPTGAGVGNGTAGARGARGAVASSGFGSGIAIGNSPASSTVSVRQAGFGSMETGSNAGQSHPAESVGARLVPAEILSKPTPIYTDEARAKRIEGEVLLEVVFEASGKLRVVRIVRGLGHGLDDSAVQAAEQIRFKPALKDGQPSDSTAVVHIIFQLA